MQRPTCRIEIVFEPIDLLPELVAIASIPIPVSVRALMLATQALVLAMESLELGDQLLTTGRVPPRMHAPVMPRLPNEYKYEVLDFGPAKVISTPATR
jgi:hypothetical protein